MALTKATLIDLNSNELILDLDADTSITADTDDTIHIKIAGSDELTLTSTAIAPSTSDGQALGTSSLMFSDLFLASGSVLNFNNGDVTLTHASNLLTLDGGSLDLDGEALILDADGDTKIAESSDDVIHLTFAGSTSTPTEFGAGYMNLKNQGTRSYIRFYCESSNAHYTELRAAAHSDYSGNVQVTLPTTAGTLATLAGTETFTNKTLTTPRIVDDGYIQFGTDNEVRLISNPDKGVILKHTATSDDKPVILTLQTGETDMAADDVMGKIEFQAPDEGTGTDAILVAAAIQAVSEGDFSSSSNATRLEFHTGASEAASSKMTLSSAGLLTIADDLMIKDGGTIGVASTNDALTISSAGLLTVKDDLIIKSGGTIGGAGDTDLLTLGSDILTVAGEVSMTTLDIGGTNVTATAAELNLLDGGTSVGSSITLADADGFVVNDGGTMKTIPASDIKTYNPGGTAWQSVITSNTTMVSGRGYFVNTSGGAITMTLPSSASLGDYVQIIDYAATADTNNITIGRNSHKIQGDAADLTVSTERAAFTLVYVDATYGWLLDNK
jgi:hypothetical protein